MDSDFHRSRRQLFHKHLGDNEAVLLFAGKAPRKTADRFYRFFANRNFYYMTGVLQEESIFFAAKNDDTVSEYLFTLKKDLMAERWHGHRLTREETSKMSCIEDINDLETFEQKLKTLINAGGIKSIWYDFDTHKSGTTDSPENQHCDHIRKAYPFITFKNAYSHICSERTVKTSEEINHIKQAMCITRDGIHAMMKQVKPGMNEYQLA